MKQVIASVLSTIGFGNKIKEIAIKIQGTTNADELDTLSNGTVEGHRKRVISYLNEGNKLTSLEALRLFGCARLASRINELRNSGHDIRKTMIVVGDKKARVAQYYLVV